MTCTGFVALLRGINVGGNNLIRMPELELCLLDAGFAGVHTYIQSGNVLLTDNAQSNADLEARLEAAILERFGLPIMVVTRSHDELARAVSAAPASHGSPERRSDVWFFKDPLEVDSAFAQLPELREGVDEVAMGTGVWYFSRLDALASTSRMTKFLSNPVYKRVTIRNWRTTTKLLELLDSAV